MTQLASFARVSLFATAAIALASACGGQSFTDDGGGDAGKGQGGTSAHAGTTGTAGKGHAGSSSTGGTSMGGGSGGVAGGPTEECYGAPESGNCDAYVPSWYHDPSTGICRPFVYGGCGGNKNRYPTLEACNKACPGGAPNYDECKVPSDCVVTGTGCCGICDSPNVTAHDLIAYNRQYANVLQCAVALKIAPPGSGADVGAPIACAPCPPPTGQGTLMYFVPDCVAGQCVVQDLRTSALTACKTSAECQLRHGTGCCEGCSNAQLLAVRNDGSFEKFACSSGPQPCPQCIAPPTDAQPFCGPTGHCEVVVPL